MQRKKQAKKRERRRDVKRNRHCKEHILYVFKIIIISGLILTFWGLSIFPYNKNAMAYSAQDLEKRLRALLMPDKYSYDPLGKPDPFRPITPFSSSNMGEIPSDVINAAGKGEALSLNATIVRPCASSIECIDIGQLNIVAIIEINGNKRMAMLESSSGKGFLVEKGDKIGITNGYVKDILPEKVIIEDYIRDLSGKPVLRKRVFVLHPEE